MLVPLLQSDSPTARFVRHNLTMARLDSLSFVFTEQIRGMYSHYLSVGHPYSRQHYLPLPFR
jgi:hypothetical protein